MLKSSLHGADLLALAGRALYRQRWVLPLGRALSMPDGTFRPLTTGKGQIAATIWPEILGLVVAQQRELRTAANFLKAQIAGDRVVAQASREIPHGSIALWVP
jgi:hypothetical protein